MKNKTIYTLLAILTLNFIGCSQSDKTNEITIAKDILQDKIKGGWAGQTIGCTFGGPTEFRYREQIIPDSVVLDLPEDRIEWYFDHSPGLYDDVYMDLTFVDVFDRLGLDAPADSFAMAFAYAGYPLWHANLGARYNIRNGMMPPTSGHWKENPHANDIDYQIEADFAGLMSPGMPNTASEISDKIGHIMNYGDGWYGGVFVGAMYSLAFITDNIDSIVERSLRTIPAESRFYKTIADVIAWHKQYPDDWKKTWQLCQDKWATDDVCPEGAFTNYNIDASINSAYVVIGLLYGDGDFTKTMDISTRCGQDSDCNPATAAGILGTMNGYGSIPEKYKKALPPVENRNFAYTNISLNKVYDLSMNQALQVIERNGGHIDGENVTIVTQEPKPVKLEVAFEGLNLSKKIDISKELRDFNELQFDGNSFVIRGQIKAADKQYIANIEITIDDKPLKTVEVGGAKHCNEICWHYGLEPGEHKLGLKWLNPEPQDSVKIWSAVIFK